MAGKTRREDEIKEIMSAANFWENQEKAQKFVSELRQLTVVSKPLRELGAAGEDLKVLMEFADEDESGASLAELIEAGETLRKRLDAMELQAMLSGPNVPVNSRSRRVVTACTRCCWSRGSPSM